MRKLHIVALLLAGFAFLAMPARSSAQISVGIAVHIGPPALPVYDQPLCPAPGYLWTPGYWAYGPDGYYWVPGTWVEPPAVGVLWTPGYWGWGDGGYFWHAGYWGPHVGFYGGINYGFGYTGVGFVGGRWDHGVFAYNTAVMHVDTRVIHTTYVDRTVIRNVGVSRVSFNGGRGGIVARPTREDIAVEHEHHYAATSVQTEHAHAASTNRAYLNSVNHGRPAVAATARPGEFAGRGAAGAESRRTDRPPSANNEHRNGASESTRTDRPAARAGSNESRAPRENEANRPPKSESHAQNKPQKESKPTKEAKPHSEDKPHRNYR
ncbi:MAG: YXWGXW repeat-containing protein [Candidatus Acidiferrum sp.]